MEFNGGRITWVESGSNLVQLLGNPVSLPFEDADATQNEMFLSGVSSRSGLVNVEKMQASPQKKGQPREDQASTACKGQTSQLQD
ncbi:hypothetical protein D3C87_2007830 [compost metagenome]